MSCRSLATCGVDRLAQLLAARRCRAGGPVRAEQLSDQVRPHLLAAVGDRGGDQRALQRGHPDVVLADRRTGPARPGRCCRPGSACRRSGWPPPAGRRSSRLPTVRSSCSKPNCLRLLLDLVARRARRRAGRSRCCSDSVSASIEGDLRLRADRRRRRCGSAAPRSARCSSGRPGSRCPWCTPFSSAAAATTTLKVEPGGSVSPTAPGSAAACPGRCSSLSYAAAAAVGVVADQRVRVEAGHRDHAPGSRRYAGRCATAAPLVDADARCCAAACTPRPGPACESVSSTLPPPASVAGEHVLEPVGEQLVAGAGEEVVLAAARCRSRARLTGL